MSNYYESQLKKIQSFLLWPAAFICNLREIDACIIGKYFGNYIMKEKELIDFLNLHI
jgi:hypothetical protein